MGGFTGLFDRPDPETAVLVKNPALQGYIDTATRNYGALTKAGDAGLDAYIQKFLAGQGAAERTAGQETGAVDEFYNGTMANRLADLRARRMASVNAAADVASNQAIRGLKSNRLVGDGSGSSYAQRVATGALAPIRTGAAVDAANAERGDLDYLTGNRINLAGARTRIADTLAGRELTPYNTRLAMSKDNTGVLSGIIQQDQANKFYGIKQKPGLLDRMQQEVQFLQGLQSIMKNQYGTAAEGAGGWSSMAGGGGGGGGGMGSMMGGMRRGGLVRAYEEGGEVEGPGTGTSDSIVAHLSDGEFVVPASAVRMPGVLPLLEKIRALGLAREGGPQHPGITVTRNPRLAYGGLLYADSWGGIGGQNLQRDQFNEATMAGEVAAIQQEKQFGQNQETIRQGQSQKKDQQEGDMYREALRYYGMPKGGGGGGEGGGVSGPSWGGGYSYGGGNVNFAEGGRVNASESPSTRMWRTLWEKRQAELAAGEGDPSPAQLNRQRLDLANREMSLRERQLSQQEAAGTPAEIRDKEFQEKMLADVGTTGGIDSLDHARRLAPNASPTAHQLAFEASASVRQPAEQSWLNANRGAALLNAYDKAVEVAGGQTKPIGEPGGAYKWFDKPEDADKRKTVNDAIAIQKKLGPAAMKLRQSALVQQDPESMTWVPAVARPRWLKDSAAPATPGSEAAIERTGDYSRSPYNTGGGRQTTMDVAAPVVPGSNAPAAAAIQKRRYPQPVYDRVRQLTGQGMEPARALTQALKEAQQ